MNLFQTLEDAAGLGAAPSTPSSAPPGVMAAIIQMLQSQPGGIPGVIQQFEGAGLGGLVQSWLGSAASQPVGPEQVEHALGQAPSTMWPTSSGCPKARQRATSPSSCP